MAVNRLATVQSKSLTRCPWPSQDALMTAYHDQEWGVPIHDDRALFEFLILEALKQA